MTARRITSSSEYRALILAAESQGWTIEPTKGGHLRWKPPSGGPIFSSASPSDWRASKKLRAQLRRAGLRG